MNRDFIVLSLAVLAKYFLSLLCIVLAASSEVTNDASPENCGQKAAWSVYMDVVTDVIGKAKNVSVTCQDTDGQCGQKETLMSYLEVAEEMINKAKIHFPDCDDCSMPQQQIQDCSDVLRMGYKSSGVYTISPINRLTENEPIDVFCDMETDGGGWTVIQRRGDYQNPFDYFNKDWKSYKEGFGDIQKEFWLGNDNIYALTNQGIYSARFDLVDIENNKRHAQYDTFRIDDESSKYTLHIANYSGDAGESMIVRSNNQKFSTKDQKNDASNNRSCAHVYNGAWWFSTCFDAYLNGENSKGKPYNEKGLIWSSWKGFYESLIRTEIKIRPKDFRKV